MKLIRPGTAFARRTEDLPDETHSGPAKFMYFTMVKNAIILLLLSLLAQKKLLADIKFVDFNKIDPSGKCNHYQHFLLDNLTYYDHWSPDWIYDVPKDSLIRELKLCIRSYEPLQTDDYELDLLLGELAHYLYNLDEKSYYDSAEVWYQKAIRINSKDIRGYWFLGYACVTSDEVEKALAAFQLALKLVDDRTSVDFWQEYAFAMNVAGRPFHCLYALDQYRRRGGSSLLSKVMDSTVRAKCNAVDPDISYRSTTLWQSQHRGSQVQFLSYPLGIRLDVDSNWRLQVSGYANRITGWGIQPPALTTKDGRKIGYSIAMVVKVPANGERLEDFVVSMMKKLSGIRDSVFPFAREYPHGVSYSYNDNGLYSDRGGARIRFFGIERAVPDSPGLALEDDKTPTNINGEPGKLNVYTLGIVRSRFPERIFYLFVLDTCGDIQEDSWKGFQRLMTQQLVIE